MTVVKICNMNVACQQSEAVVIPDDARITIKPLADASTSGGYRASVKK